MINSKQKEKLKASWGEKASSLSCLAEVRIYDPLSPWECYIYAMNPENEDQICCLIKGFFVETCEWSLSELANRFNVEGEAPVIDKEYRPRRAAELFKKLNETEIYERD
jgi:hypothetical protein